MRRKQAFGIIFGPWSQTKYPKLMWIRRIVSHFSMDTRCAGLKRVPHGDGSVGRKALSGSSRAASQWDDVNVLGRNMLDYVGS